MVVGRARWNKARATGCDSSHPVAAAQDLPAFATRSGYFGTPHLVRSWQLYRVTFSGLGLAPVSVWAYKVRMHNGDRLSGEIVTTEDNVGEGSPGYQFLTIGQTSLSGTVGVAHVDEDYTTVLSLRPVEERSMTRTSLGWAFNSKQKRHPNSRSLRS